jgi:drug/metabolite transporter (DMT)-like permease
MRPSDREEVNRMAVVLALGAAVVYGSADFMGGLVARRASALSVALGAQLSGLVLLATALPFLGPSTVTGTDLAWGALAGVFGGAGLVMLLGVLARGPMSIVAPTTALSAAVVPILAGLLQGDRPGALAFVGMAVALVAVALVTREPSSRRAVGGGVSLSLVATALAAGVVFGLFFVALHRTGHDAGLWPLLAARLVSVPMLGAMVLRRRTPLGWGRPGVGNIVLLSGALDMAANILYLLALRHGMLAVVAAVAGLYPASTVLLARAQLDERLHRVQVAGLVVAASAAVLIAI